MRFPYHRLAPLLRQWQRLSFLCAASRHGSLVYQLELRQGTPPRLAREIAHAHGRRITMLQRSHSHKGNPPAEVIHLCNYRHG